MTREEIVNVCQKNLAVFVDKTKNISYEKRGVLASEALLIASIVDYFNVPLILESGRARGHSTQLLAENFKDNGVRIVSIDYEKNADTAYSEEILQQYKLVEVHYGDSNKVLTEHISDDCVVFIDGPKGEAALILAANLLRNKKVKAVLVHDVSQNRFTRTIAEAIFSHQFFSDDEKFVNYFKHIDEKCWKIMSDAGNKPYVIHGKVSESYGPTIGVFFNSESPLVEPAFFNYQQYLKDKEPTLKKVILENANQNGLLFNSIRRIYRMSKRG